MTRDDLPGISPNSSGFLGTMEGDAGAPSGCEDPVDASNTIGVARRGAWMELTHIRMAVMGLLLAAPGWAQTADERVRFADPVRIMAGAVPAGAGRSYPSPAIHDIDGDQLPDLVIADLWGAVTYARRSKSLRTITFLAEKPVPQIEGGGGLKFSNW